jgi:glutamate decarboxylase
MPLHRQVADERTREELAISPMLAQPHRSAVVPRFRMPEATIPPDVAARVVRDELSLDGNARLNLATFVTTWMEPEAEALTAGTFDKNMIDEDEYP